jgi:hypothetical protein
MAVEQLPDIQAAASSQSTPSLSRLIKSFGGRIISWIKTCGDYYAAAAIYDELRGLSDAELKRRGLSRETLAGDVCTACDSACNRTGTTEPREHERPSDGARPPMADASTSATVLIIGKVRAR